MKLKLRSRRCERLRAQGHRREGGERGRAWPFESSQQCVVKRGEEDRLQTVLNCDTLGLGGVATDSNFRPTRRTLQTESEPVRGSIPGAHMPRPRTAVLQQRRLSGRAPCNGAPMTRSSTSSPETTSSPEMPQVGDGVVNKPTPTAVQ